MIKMRDDAARSAIQRKLKCDRWPMRNSNNAAPVRKYGKRWMILFMIKISGCYGCRWSPVIPKPIALFLSIKLVAAPRRCWRLRYGIYWKESSSLSKIYMALTSATIIAIPGIPWLPARKNVSMPRIGNWRGCWFRWNGGIELGNLVIGW